MIYTVTFNPSLDYIASADNFELGKVNRTNNEILFPGGKGINVSIVLNNLGMESIILGFTAGFTGNEIKRLVTKMGCKEDMINIDNGISRINVKLRSNVETELNGMGPIIDDNAINKLYKKLDGLQDGDVLVLAGSIPASMPEDMYMNIMKYLADKNILIAVDATKDLLMNVMEYRPFVVKPNNHELGEIFGVELKDKTDVISYAKKLQEKGARNVIVSMAGDGAVMITEDGQAYASEAPKGKVVNSVGAGDSMVAGFIYGYLKERDYKTAFKYGISSGSASAFSENLATRQEIEEILETLTF